MALAPLLRAATLALVIAAVPALAAERLVELFVREGCPHCAEAEAFLVQLRRAEPDLVLVVRDVGHDRAALARLQALSRDAPGAVARVPATYAGGQLIVGYSSLAHTDRLIRAALAGERAAASVPTDAGATCAAEGDALACAAPQGDGARFEVTVLGRTLALDEVGLPLFALAIGLLDGFNPCSMWVLVLMLSLLAPLADRWRMAVVAGTFVAVQGVAYFVMLTAWLNAFLLIGLARWSEIALGALAVAAGAVNVKDYFAFGRGLSLSIPATRRADILRRFKALLQAPTLGATVAGTIVLGVLVQFVELLCTSGFPALFTRILTLHAPEGARHYGYLALYLAAYMLDDVVVLGIGIVTLSRYRLQEREGRGLKLAAGLAMVGLGAYLLWP